MAKLPLRPPCRKRNRSGMEARRVKTEKIGLQLADSPGRKATPQERNDG
ncbi:hypothetical protein [Agrobacterium fabrum]